MKKNLFFRNDQTQGLCVQIKWIYIRSSSLRPAVYTLLTKNTILVSALRCTFNQKFAAKPSLSAFCPPYNGVCIERVGYISKVYFHAQILSALVSVWSILLLCVDLQLLFIDSLLEKTDVDLLQT